MRRGGRTLVHTWGHREKPISQLKVHMKGMCLESVRFIPVVDHRLLVAL